MPLFNLAPSADFRRFSGCFPTGVAVVTTCDAAGNRFGITINAVTSLSLDPPQFLVCLDNSSNTLTALRDSGAYCIHYLSADQAHLSCLFSSKETDKFAGVDCAKGELGSPILPNVVAASECRVVTIYPGGDHAIVVGAVETITINGGEPLVYHRGAYTALAA